MELMASSNVVTETAETSFTGSNKTDVLEEEPENSGHVSEDIHDSEGNSRKEASRQKGRDRWHSHTCSWCTQFVSALITRECVI